MTEEILANAEGKDLPIKPQVTIKKKRDIFRFNGEKDIAINLEHVTAMHVEGKRVTFEFYQTATFIDVEDEEAAKRAFDQIIGVWSADVVE